MPFEPASHEDARNPGSLKRVLFRKDELSSGHVQMVNWACLPASKSFRIHYHQDMDEIFVIITGEVEITVADERAALGPGDAVLIPMKAAHRMVNTGSVDVEYIVIGISRGTGGKTVVTE